jgi:hypothetical protein
VVQQKEEAAFVPSRELLGDKAILISESKTKMVALGMDLNSNYQGDITDFDIENFKCFSKLNCALRLENISANATDKEIFDVFHEGKIFSFSKKDPVPGRFTNCAGRLVFMTRAATEAFLQRAQTVGVSIRGEYMKVIWNRDRCCPAKESEYHQSRVIQMQDRRMSLMLSVLRKCCIESLGLSWLILANGWQRAGEELLSCNLPASLAKVVWQYDISTSTCSGIVWSTVLRSGMLQIHVIACHSMLRVLPGTGIHLEHRLRDRLAAPSITSTNSNVL